MSKKDGEAVAEASSSQGATRDAGVTSAQAYLDKVRAEKARWPGGTRY